MRHLLVIILVVVVSACTPRPQPDPCLIGGCEGEGEGEGEGEASLDDTIEATCQHLDDCERLISLEGCIENEGETVAKYASCAGFEAGYVGLSECVQSACEPDCFAEAEALHAVLLECVAAPVADTIDGICEKLDTCFEPNAFCAESQAENLVPAGPNCIAAHDALNDALACYDENACADLANCDPQFAEYYDQIFFCQAGPPPLGEPFPENRHYERNLFPGQECNPELVGNCFQTFEACADHYATYVVTDILLEGLYAELEGVVTLELTETGGETASTVRFTVQDNGDRLIRDDGAEFIWNRAVEPFCD